MTRDHQIEIAKMFVTEVSFIRLVIDDPKRGERNPEKVSKLCDRLEDLPDARLSTAIRFAEGFDSQLFRKLRALRGVYYVRTIPPKAKGDPPILIFDNGAADYTYGVFLTELRKFANQDGQQEFAAKGDVKRVAASLRQWREEKFPSERCGTTEKA